MNSGAMNTRGAESPVKNVFDLRLLFPERLADFGKYVPTAQFRRVLVNRRGGIGVLLRAMAQHHQHGVAEWFAVHAKGLAEDAALRKPAPEKSFWLKPFFVSSILSNI